MEPVQRFLTEDHARLEALLACAVADPERIDGDAYAQFRAGLLRHIGMEEKILLPAAPAVPVAKYCDGPKIIEATRRALAREGYDLGEYERAASCP